MSTRPRRVASRSTSPRDAALAHQSLLTKPRGSLGRLEDLAAWYAAARGTFPVEPPASGHALALFLADHGVVVEGVSAYGSQVTAAMACNVMAGGAAVNVLARGRRGVELPRSTSGIAGDLSAAPRGPVVPLCPPVRAGTRNLRVEPAMTRDEADAAMAVGACRATTFTPAARRSRESARSASATRPPAAALVASSPGVDPEAACGRGTGIDDETLARGRSRW